MNEYAALVLKMIGELRADGARCPALVFFGGSGDVPAALWPALGGKGDAPAPREAGGDVYGACLGVEAESLASKAQAHAGPGGAFLARFLRDDAIAGLVRAWGVVVWDEHFAVSGLDESCKPLFTRDVPFAGIARGNQTLGEMVSDGGPSRIGVHLGGGRRVTVYGRTGFDACAAAGLAGAILQREITLPHEGKPVTISLRDDATLLSMVTRLYGNSPHQIAEAVRALRQAPGDPSKPFLRLLRNKPDTEPLYRKVRFELDGTTA